MMALKALPRVSVCANMKIVDSSYLVDPRKIKPKMTTRAKLRYSEFKGTFSLGWTLEKKGEKGRPPSRAKA